MRLRGLVALLLRQLLVLSCTILGSALALLRGTFAAQRVVPGQVTRSLLGPAEQFVEKSHRASSQLKSASEARIPRARKPQAEIWAIKTPEPANPKVHRLWLDEHKGAAAHSSRVRRGEKRRTLRTSAGLTRPVGTIARAVAKKVRTPPPPKRVQAPQRRDTRKSGTAAGGRPPWFYAALGALVVAVVAGAAFAFIALRDDGGGSSDNGTRTTATSYNTLPGIRKTKAPWDPEYEFLADRLLPLGLQTLGAEGQETHYHSHLDIFVDGKKVEVPALIGINSGAQYITELHTHDTRGVIHVESPKANDEFSLGQFMGEWGVFLNSKCIGGYCDGLKWYVNGKQQTGNPETLILKPHQEIAIVVGEPPAKIPSSYKFASGE